MTDNLHETVLRGINQWCDYELGDCGMRRTRYDNCKCRQQAQSVMDAMDRQLVELLREAEAEIQEADRKAMHPAELPDHLKEAVRNARMGPEHEHLNSLMREEPSP